MVSSAARSASPAISSGQHMLEKRRLPTTCHSCADADVNAWCRAMIRHRAACVRPQRLRAPAATAKLHQGSPRSDGAVLRTPQRDDAPHDRRVRSIWLSPTGPPAPRTGCGSPDRRVGRVISSSLRRRRWTRRHTHHIKVARHLTSTRLATAASERRCTHWLSASAKVGSYSAAACARSSQICSKTQQVQHRRAPVGCASQHRPRVLAGARRELSSIWSEQSRAALMRIEGRRDCFVQRLVGVRETPPVTLRLSTAAASMRRSSERSVPLPGR